MKLRKHSSTYSPFRALSLFAAAVLSTLVGSAHATGPITKTLRQLDTPAPYSFWKGIQSPQNTDIASDPARAFATGDDSYRLGDEWGKKTVTDEVLRQASVAFRRAALATARTGGATGFYLGKFGNTHVMATNHHVFPNAWNCLNRNVRFPFLNREFKCVAYFGTWPEIDLSLFAIEVTRAEDERLLAEVAGNFSFQTELTPGQELLTIGFGVAHNPNRLLVANQDSDCKVFSNRGEYRLMADPDEYNPGSYRAWSFANGCDVSHGDSGSAMVDRQTGRVVGIIWTGRIPKSADAQSSATLGQWLNTGAPQIWTELSYAVPASKIGEVLRRVADAVSTPEGTREVLNRLLAQ
jgi:hypothetical protein